MQPKAPKLLEDIRDAAGFILQMSNDRTVENYKTDRMLRQAIERNFEIIGEALNRLSKIDPQLLLRISDHQRIISFRNILIHGYDAILEERVWDAVQNHLPNLMTEVEELLAP